MSVVEIQGVTEGVVVELRRGMVPPVVAADPADEVAALVLDLRQLVSS